MILDFFQYREIVEIVYSMKNKIKYINNHTSMTIRMSNLSFKVTYR